MYNMHMFQSILFQATAKYHEMLNSVREFMTLNEVPRTLCERVLDYVVSKWANTKGVDQVSKYLFTHQTDLLRGHP